MNCLTSERLNSGESLVNFSHLERIHTFKKICSGEYLSHLQKIQLFGRFDCGESLEYFSHLLNISHICKDSDIQKIPLQENTILSLGQNLNIIFSTSLHFTSPPLSASLHATSCHLTSPPILSLSLHAAFCYFCFTSPNFTPLNLSSHFVRIISRQFTLPPVLFASLHLTSRHFTPLHFASHSFCISSPHFVPLCFASPPFSPPHFTPLHFTLLCLPHITPFCATSLHLPFSEHHFTSLHLTSPILFASLHLTSCHFASPPLPFPCLTSCHFTSPPVLSS